MFGYDLFEQTYRLVLDAIRVLGRIWPYTSSFGYLDKDGRLSNSRKDPL